jgi:hypothetical protein
MEREGREGARRASCSSASGDLFVLRRSPGSADHSTSTLSKASDDDVPSGTRPPRLARTFYFLSLGSSQLARVYWAPFLSPSPGTSLARVRPGAECGGGASRKRVGYGPLAPPPNPFASLQRSLRPQRRQPFPPPLHPAAAHLSAVSFPYSGNSLQGSLSGEGFLILIAGRSL